MIIYIFNGYFPDQSGFGNRCLREITALSTQDDIQIICRGKTSQPSEERLNGFSHSVIVNRFEAKSEVVKRPENYQPTGWYELKRNLELIRSMQSTVLRIFSKFKKSSPIIYTVNSPLSVSIVVILLAKLFSFTKTIVCFHDLEPELGMHLKKITASNWIIKLEFLLEKIACKMYSKVVVTSQTQRHLLSERVGINQNRVISIPNSNPHSKNINQLPSIDLPVFTKEDFVIGYVSTISFDYTTDGLKDFLMVLAENLDQNKYVKVLIMGAGPGLDNLISFIKDNNLHSNVFCLGHVDYPETVLSQVKAGIIPWKKDIMTSTMLPTKLFDYLALKLPVIAPAFGEFSKILENNQNACLFQNFEEILGIINNLNQNTKYRIKIGQEGLNLYLNKFTPVKLNNKFIDLVTS